MEERRDRSLITSLYWSITVKLAWMALYHREWQALLEQVQYRYPAL